MTQIYNIMIIKVFAAFSDSWAFRITEVIVQIVFVFEIVLKKIYVLYGVV